MLHDDYSPFLKELEEKGYAHEVPLDQYNGKSLDACYIRTPSWYLPSPQNGKNLSAF